MVTIGEAQKAFDDAVAARDAHRSELLARYTAEWRTLGCERCDGVGYVRGHPFYNEHVGMPEFDPCPADGCTASTVGPMPRDGEWRGHAPVLPFPEIVRTADDAKRYADLEENVDVAFMLWDGIKKRLALMPGCRVKAVKGRKIKVGTTGTVRWVGEEEQRRARGDWRHWRYASFTTEQRVGVILDGGDNRMVYTDAHNLEVIEASEAHTVTIDNDLPRLYGSEKQRRWAEQIRSAAIKAGRVSVEQAKKQDDCRYWIDNRATLAA